MSTEEVNRFLSVVNGIPAGFAVPVCPVASEFVKVVFLKLFPQGSLDQIGGKIENTNHVRQVFEYIYKGSGHLSPHIEVVVFGLEQLNGVLNCAVRSQVLHDLPVYEEEHLYFVLGKV